MKMIDYHPDHPTRLKLQPSQEYLRAYCADESYRKFINFKGNSFSFVDGDDVLACAGVIPLWEGRGEAWTLLGANLKRHFLWIHHRVVGYLEGAQIRRIEANIAADDPAAQQWIEYLGFKFEGLMPAYWPGGRTAMRYARVK